MSGPAVDLNIAQALCRYPRYAGPTGQADDHHQDV
jgi:hypothetical protein